MQSRPSRAIFWALAAYGLVLSAVVALGLCESLPPGRRFFGYVAAMAWCFRSTVAGCRDTTRADLIPDTVSGNS